MGTSNSEIDILELWAQIWQRRLIISAVSFVAGAIAIGVSFAMPNVYRAAVLAAPTSSEDSLTRGSTSLGGLGSIASLAGAYTPVGDRSHESVAVLQSRQFIWKYINDEGLMPILFADDWDGEKNTWSDPDTKEWPSAWDAYRLFIDSGVLSVSTDKETGFVTVAIEWTNPIAAADWANSLVDQLNDYMRRAAIERSERNLQYLQEELERTQIAEIRQTIFQLIGEEQKTAMMANTQKEFAFRILDKAAVPDKKVGPKRGLIGVLTTLITLLIIVLIVLTKTQIRSGQGI